MGAPECTYDEATHTYRIGGHIVPGVTSIVRTVLAPMPVFTGKQNEVMQRAMKFGTAVHTATELWDKGVLDMDALSPALVGPLNSWREFRRNFPGEILQNEKSVYSIRYRFGGRLDRLIAFKDGIKLVDLKTGTTYDPAFGPQTAGYVIASTEDLKLKIKGRLVVMLNEDGYTLHEEENKHDETLFLQALTCYNWRRKYGRTLKTG